MCVCVWPVFKGVIIIYMHMGVYVLHMMCVGVVCDIGGLKKNNEKNWYNRAFDLLECIYDVFQSPSFIIIVRK